MFCASIHASYWTVQCVESGPYWFKVCNAEYSIFNVLQCKKKCLIKNLKLALVWHLMNNTKANKWGFERVQIYWIAVITGFLEFGQNYFCKNEKLNNSGKKPSSLFISAVKFFENHYRRNVINENSKKTCACVYFHINQLYMTFSSICFWQHHSLLSAPSS